MMFAQHRRTQRALSLIGSSVLLLGSFACGGLEHVDDASRAAARGTVRGIDDGLTAVRSPLLDQWAATLSNPERLEAAVERGAGAVVRGGGRALLAPNDAETAAAMARLLASVREQLVALVDALGARVNEIGSRAIAAWLAAAATSLREQRVAEGIKDLAGGVTAQILDVTADRLTRSLGPATRDVLLQQVEPAASFARRTGAALVAGVAEGLRGTDPQVLLDRARPLARTLAAATVDGVCDALEKRFPDLLQRRESGWTRLECWLAIGCGVLVLMCIGAGIAVVRLILRQARTAPHD